MKDGFEYPQKLDPRSEPFQVALHELRRIILDQMEKLLIRLFFNPGFPSLYRDYKGGLDYKTFEQKLLQGLEEVRAKEAQGDKSNLPYFFRILSDVIESNSPELGKVNSQEEREDISPQILSLLMSDDYSPPTEWKDIIIHLSYLFAYWDLHSRNQNLLEDFIPLGDLILLFSFCKLMGASYELLTSNTMKGERELPRTKKSSQKQKNNAQKKREYIVKILPHVKNKVTEERKTLNTMAIAIKDDWINFPPKDKDIKKPPGITLISETLKKSGKFEQIGGLWILKM